MKKSKKEKEEYLAEIDKLKLQIRNVSEMSKFVPSIKLDFLDLDTNFMNSYSVDLSNLEKLFNQFVSLYGENDSNVKAFKSILDQLSEQSEAAKKQADEFSKSLKIERETITKDFQQIQTFQQDIVSKLSMGDSNKNKNQNQTIPPPPNQASQVELYKFLWSKLDDDCSCAEEWRSILSIKIEIPSETIIEQFRVIQPEEGKLLAPLTLKKYQSILKASKMEAKQIAKAIQEELFSLQTGPLEKLINISLSTSEKQLLNSFDGDILKLGQPIQLAIFLERISNWRDKAIQLLEHHKFDIEISNLLQDVSRVDQAIKTIMSSKHLKKYPSDCS